MAMVIIIDDREKMPYDFNIFPGKRIKTDRARLLIGDYTIAGLEGDIAAERKTESDFFNCLDADVDRFTRQVTKGKTLIINYRVFVESTQATVEQILKQNILLQNRYYYLRDYIGVHFSFYNGMKETAGAVLRWFKRIYAAGEKAAIDGLMPSEKTEIFTNTYRENTYTAPPPIIPFNPPPVQPPQMPIFQPPPDEP